MAKRDALEPPKSNLVTQARKAAKAIGDMTGVGAMARMAVEAHDATIDRLAELARTNGVSEKKVESALKMYDRAQQLQSLIALVLPVVPNLVLLRALAGAKERSAREASAPKKLDE